MVFYHSEEYLYKMNFIQNEIVLGVLVFTIAVNLMVFIILGARKLLVSSGNISISMNDAAKSIDVEAGGKLLQTLAAQNLFLSSACGGGGTCAQCKCKVISGGGSILPTEESHFTNKEKKEGWRLSCQVPVKDDMEIVVPDEVFGARKWECEVVSNKNVATFIKELVLKLPEGEEVAFKAGGYVQMEIPPYELDYKSFDIEEEYHGDWDRFGVWRTPLRHLSQLLELTLWPIIQMKKE